MTLVLDNYDSFGQPAGRGYPSPHPTPAALRAANGRGETPAAAGGRQDDPR